MVVKSGASKNKNTNKRSLAAREKEAVVVDEADEFPEESKIDLPTDSEPSDSGEDDEDEEDMEGGDFDEVLKRMAEDQGFSSASDEVEDGDEEDNEQEEEGEESGSDIHSSDIEGVSSEEEEEGSDDELGSDASDSNQEDNSDKELVLKRVASRATDGQDTAVESSENENENENGSDDDEDEDEAARLANEGLERLTIRDFGKDLEAWKEYRKTLPQIDAGYA
ncbi:hypothetical protein H4S06_006707, partial [Coemansia sp. BCRC 34490]